MKPNPDLIRALEERFAHAVIAYVDEDGYPMSIATEFRVDPDRGVVVLQAVAGEAQPPVDERVNVVFSHIRPQPGIGYDERRYVSLWGPLSRAEEGLEFIPEREQHWDEQEMTFFEYSERGVPQALRYLEQVSAERGREVRPKLSLGWLFLRTTRLPFLTATFVPVLLGIAVAAWTNGFNWWLALITLIGVTNIVNTLDTNIKLRRREIAMLKSVGLTPGGFRRMLRYESLFYGLTALLYGLPIGIALSFLIYKQFGGVIYFAFTLPWWAIAATVLGILAIVFATMMVSGAMIRNDNIVDTLKEENL
jgi:F0F1-type ATP synthase assembly protein I